MKPQCGDHSYESCLAVLHCGAVYYAVQGGSNSVEETLVCDHSNESYWAVLSPGFFFFMLYKMVLTFNSVDETLVCDHSNESYYAVLSCGTVYYSVQGGSNF